MDATHGYVDELSLTRVEGWTRQLAQGSPDEVQIRINDRVFLRPANQPRADLIEKGIGNAAFCFEIPPDLMKEPFVEIEVRAKSTGRTLPRGFRTFRGGQP